MKHFVIVSNEGFTSRESRLLFPASGFLGYSGFGRSIKNSGGS